MSSFQLAIWTVPKMARTKPTFPRLAFLYMARWEF